MPDNPAKTGGDLEGCAASDCSVPIAWAEKFGLMCEARGRVREHCDHCGPACRDAMKLANNRIDKVLPHRMCSRGEKLMSSYIKKYIAVRFNVPNSPNA